MLASDMPSRDGGRPMVNWHFRPRLHSIQATDGAARAEPCSHELCRVATEVEHSSTDGTFHPGSDESCSSFVGEEIPLPLLEHHPAVAHR